MYLPISFTRWGQINKCMWCGCVCVWVCVCAWIVDAVARTGYNSNHSRYNITRKFTHT
jgi:hypothetical protein